MSGNHNLRIRDVEHSGIRILKLFRIPDSGYSAFRTAGFTLMELLAVMLILAVLAGLGVKGYSLARRSAKESRAQAEIEILRTALNEYRVEYGRFPGQAAPAAISQLPVFDELVELTQGVEAVDPWGNDYRYLSTNRFQCSVWSTGQDADSDADDINPSPSGY